MVGVIEVGRYKVECKKITLLCPMIELRVLWGDRERELGRVREGFLGRRSGKFLRESEGQ